MVSTHRPIFGLGPSCGHTRCKPFFFPFSLRKRSLRTPHPFSEEISVKIGRLPFPSIHCAPLTHLGPLNPSRLASLPPSLSMASSSSTPFPNGPLKIAIIGFGPFAQFLAKTFLKQGHILAATSRSDYSLLCSELGITFYRDMDELMEAGSQVILLCTSILSLGDVIRSIPIDRLRMPLLVVDVLSVKEYPRDLLLRVLPQEADVLCTHPMFGPESGKEGWNGLPLVYEKVRIRDHALCDSYLGIFQAEVRALTTNDLVFHLLRLRVDGSDEVGGVDRSPLLPASHIGEKVPFHISFLTCKENFGRGYKRCTIIHWRHIDPTGCRMVEMSCQEHDEMAARSQFLAHTFGRILAEMGIQSTPMDTKGFQTLLQLLEKLDLACKAVREKLLERTKDVELND